MPELPEVEVIRRELAPLICTKKFGRPRLHDPGAVRHPAPEEFRERLQGRRVENLERKGKFLLIALDCGELIVHLRMTGRLVYRDNGYPPGPYLRAELPFTDGTALLFSDMRKFGGLWLLESSEEYHLTGLHRLGPDMFEQVSREQFLSLCLGRPRCMIKPLLLDQHFIAGLGNIYVDESLFRSGIHPCSEVSSLGLDELMGLFYAIRTVLKEGIEYGGTTSRDYRDARGEQGSFQHRLNVYGRKGEPCRCGHTIERIVVAGRGTYLCRQCQQRGEL